MSKIILVLLFRITNHIEDPESAGKRKISYHQSNFDHVLIICVSDLEEWYGYNQLSVILRNQFHLALDTQAYIVQIYIYSRLSFSNSFLLLISALIGIYLTFLGCVTVVGRD